MKQYLITADIYAHWGAVSPSYRVYVDNDLLTERDFIWPGHEVYVRENIVVNLKPGVHKLRIEQIGNNGKIQIKDITVDGIASKPEFTTTE